MNLKFIKSMRLKQLYFLLMIFILFASCSSDEQEAKNNEQAFPGYPYKSSYITVESGVKIHYLDEGEGDIPLLLIHGLPTSSYLWRKMIPELSINNRVIAIDLPNFGKSDKTNSIPCSGDYSQWINEFVIALGIPKVRLLNHDMGGFSGGLFAARHPEKVDAIAMFEVLFTGPIPQNFLPPFLQDLRGANSDKLIEVDNYLIETLLLNNDFNGKPQASFDRSTIATLSEEEANEFRKPFLKPSLRQALHFDRDCLGILEIEDQNKAEFIEIGNYFRETNIPRLILFGNPSFVLQADVAPPGAIDPVSNLPITMRNIVTGQVSDVVGGWKNVDEVSVYDMTTPSLHYWQNETNGAAEEAASVISNWLSTL